MIVKMIDSDDKKDNKTVSKYDFGLSIEELEKRNNEFSCKQNQLNMLIFKKGQKGLSTFG